MSTTMTDITDLFAHLGDDEEQDTEPKVLTTEERIANIEHMVGLLVKKATVDMVLDLTGGDKGQESRHCTWCYDRTSPLADCFVARPVSKDDDVAGYRRVELCPTCVLVASSYAEKVEEEDGRYAFFFPYAKTVFGRITLCPDPALNLAAYRYETDRQGLLAKRRESTLGDEVISLGPRSDKGPISS